MAHHGRPSLRGSDERDGLAVRGRGLTYIYRRATREARAPGGPPVPSHKANKFGTACEYHMADKYGLELARSPWKDAHRGRRPEPWELKATAHQHADGRPGNFKIYQKYHEKLQENDGMYGFAVYRKRGTGCQVLKTTTRAASRLPAVTWHGGGEHRDTRQAKLAIEDVF